MWFAFDSGSARWHSSFAIARRLNGRRSCTRSNSSSIRSDCSTTAECRLRRSTKHSASSSDCACSCSGVSSRADPRHRSAPSVESLTSSWRLLRCRTPLPFRHTPKTSAPVVPLASERAHSGPIDSFDSSYSNYRVDSFVRRQPPDC